MSSVRRSKRHRAGGSVEPGQSAAERSASPAPARELSVEPRPKQKRSTRGKAAVVVASTHVETVQVSASSPRVASVAPAATARAAAEHNSTANARRTRHNKTSDSPLRALEQPVRRTAKRKAAAIEQATPASVKTEERAASPAGVENGDELGYFWKYPLREHPLSSSALLLSTLELPGVDGSAVGVSGLVRVAPLVGSIDSLADAVGCLGARISELESQVEARVEDMAEPICSSVEDLDARVQHLETQVSAQTDCILYLASLSSAFRPALKELRAGNGVLHPVLGFPQHTANILGAGDESFVATPAGTPKRQEVLQGSESALDLLRMIEDNARPAAPPSRSAETTRDASRSVGPSARLPAASTPPRQTASTAPRPTRTPSSILGRIGSAVKTRLFGSTPASNTPSGSPSRPWYMSALPKPAAESATPPGSPSPMDVPVSPSPAGAFTDALAVAPTPIGQRTNRSSRKGAAKLNPLYKALMRGVEQEDKAAAAKWAKETIKDMVNDGSLEVKRKRLMKNVLYGDLKYYPSRKPWEAGFGFPLDLDDDDVAPGWAVYESMMAELAEPPSKKKKTIHARRSPDLEVEALFDTAAAARHATAVTPRPAATPSTMFSSPPVYTPGGNVFEEQQSTVDVERPVGDDSVGKAASSTPIAHNPSMGSFSVPDDSDEEDEENAAPVWTQPPPPAPVPAHAPLPGAAQGGTSDDEVSRQRSKLMKHTPARPSRLREATYPSPSILSDAGGEALAAGDGPALASTWLDTMPDADALGLDDDILAAVEERVRAKTGASGEARPWSDPILRYEEDSEEISPV